MLFEQLSYPRLQLASDCSLLVTFGNAISRQQHLDVLRLFLLLRSEAHPAIRNIHPAYSSLLISFDSLAVGPAAFEGYVHDLIGRIDSVAIPPSRTVEIPVCYDKEFGPDLEFVAAHNNIRVDEAIHYHSSTDYLLYFLGFSPGFPYLGDLPKQLVTPRLSTPRVKVPAGSVAIGGSQTGIYPVDSPGGWRIIGRTPTRLFQPDNESPTLLQMGDVVRFKPVTRKQFEHMVEKEQVGGWG